MASKMVAVVIRIKFKRWYTNLYSAGIKGRRQIMTSKVDPRTERAMYNGGSPITYVYSMKQKEVNKAFMMI